MYPPHDAPISKKGGVPAPFDPHSLPTLDQVLARTTRPPVCLYSFRLFLERRHLSAELLFWLHLRELEQLQRLHMRQLKRTASQQDLVSDLEQDAWGPEANQRGPEGTRRLSQLLAKFSFGETEPLALFSPSAASLDSTPTPASTSSQQHITAVAMPRMILHRESLLSGLDLNQEIAPQTVRDCARRVYQMYIPINADRELLGVDLDVRARVVDRVGRGELEDPCFSAEVFAEVKEHVHSRLEQYHFPLFMAFSTTRNLTERHAFWRLVLGLFMVFCGFTLMLTLIFTDVPRVDRLWGVLPFWVGMYNLSVGWTELCPLTVLVGRLYETSALRFARIEEKSVLKMLVRLAIQQLVASLIPALVITALFCAIPGRRL
ncbi:uncharacterized protein VTP21DRAFT_8460 [Calcarisporiella thermophila]|uniref:uncharacterized protein n=1 Tax=Calcarisporiella thermophila TaxID=911321 RepID=UPI003742D09A